MKIREIDESDVERVIGIYRAVYGDGFPFQQFYDARWVKKGVFDDDIVWVVAEDDEGVVCGTAAVMLNVGDADDLIGEFGRLVVDPGQRSQGAGTALAAALVERARGYVEWGFAECRTVHPGAQKICARQGFRVVGFEPMVYKIGERRESMALMAQLFGNAARLRRNNPRVIPSVLALGCHALENCGLEPDLLLAEDAVPYPWDDDTDTEQLAGEKAYRLLRIGRRRGMNREVCGGMKLEYGYLKLASHDAEYLVARRGEAIVGAAGYVHDPIDERVRLFELIAADDPTKGVLVRRFLDHVTERYAPACVQADVNAHSPRMQATLAQLGFFPVGYCPAMVFEDVERLDVVKMAKLYTPWALGQLDLVPEAVPMKDLVERAFVEQNKGRTICDLARHVHIFQGLGDEEIAALRRVCHERRLEAGEVVFEAGAPSKALYIVERGTVAIVVGEKTDVVLAEIGEGQVFGEMALVDREPRSAGAVCRTACDLLVIDYGDFHHVIEQHPEIGRKVLHNLACTLSRRLRDADRALEWRGAGERS